MLLPSVPNHKLSKNMSTSTKKYPLGSSVDRDVARRFYRFDIHMW
jgi:hypothetical protein